MLFVHRVRRGICRRNLAGGTGSGRDFGQSEVQNLSVTALGHEDVSRLDVAMDNTLIVSRIEGIGNFDG